MFENGVSQTVGHVHTTHNLELITSNHFDVKNHVGENKHILVAEYDDYMLMYHCE